MFVYPEIDPVFLRLGSFSIHWYGLMYMAAFIYFFLIGRYRCTKNNNQPFHPDLMGDYLFYLILGVIIGGRLGHVLFYDLEFYLENPLDIILIYKGGMSFHGGFIGVIISLSLFARKAKASVVAILDLIATDMPIGLMFGRIGNFINGELWGRVTDVPWAMIFPHVDKLPRHPSMLYEAALEGPVLFFLIWLYRRFTNARLGGTAIVFCMGYALIRFLVEYVREPDAHIGLYELGPIALTTGQILSLSMVFVGTGLLVFLRYRPESQVVPSTKAHKPAKKKSRRR